MIMFVLLGAFGFIFFFFSSRRRHTRLQGDWSSDVCSSDLDDLHADAVRRLLPRVRRRALGRLLAAAPRRQARTRRARPRHQQGGRAREHGRSEAPAGRGREAHRHGPARRQPAVRLLVDGRGQRAHDRGAEGQARALRVGRPRGLGRALVRITTEGTASDGVEEPTMPLVKLTGSVLVLGVAVLAAGCIAVPVGPPVAVAPPPVVVAPAPVVVAPRPYVVAPAYPVYGYYRPYGYWR